jgi:hypothetical protein
MVRVEGVTIRRLGLFAWEWEVELGGAVGSGTAWGFKRTYWGSRRAVRKVTDAATATNQRKV